MLLSEFTRGYPDVFTGQILPIIQPIGLYHLCKTNKSMIGEEICSRNNNYIIERGIKKIDCIDIESLQEVNKNYKGLPDIAVFEKNNDLYIVFQERLHYKKVLANKIGNIPFRIDIGAIRVFSVCCTMTNIYILSFDGFIYTLNSYELFKILYSMSNDVISYQPIQLDINNVLSFIADDNFVMINTTDGVYNYDEENDIFNIVYQEPALYISCSYSHIMIITRKHNLIGFGYNISGELGSGDITPLNDEDIIVGVDIKDVIDVSCGDYYTIVLSKEYLYAFGKNNCGQLCTGDNIDRLEPTIINSNILKNKNILSISCGTSHTMILTTTGLYGYGNEYGDNTYNNFQPYKINLINIIDVTCKNIQTIIINKYNRILHINGFRGLLDQQEEENAGAFEKGFNKLFSPYTLDRFRWKTVLN